MTVAPLRAVVFILFTIVAFALSLNGVLTPEAQAQPSGLTNVTVTRVVDGDTIEVSPAVQGREDVRLIGVDTPEVSGGVEPCGPEASRFTTERLEGRRVGLEFDEERVDQFDRTLAYVWVGDELFNETLVREGYAEVATFPPNDKYEDRFLAAERQARSAGLHIWSNDPCGGSSGRGDNGDAETSATRQYGDDDVIVKTIPKKKLADTSGPPVLAALLAVGMIGGGILLFRRT